MYLDELQHKLRARCGVFVSVHTLLRTLHRLHYSHKSISARALEQDEEQHAIFMNHIAEIALDPEMLMFGDEAAKDERTVSGSHGCHQTLTNMRARSARKVFKSIPFIRARNGETSSAGV